MLQPRATIHLQNIVDNWRLLSARAGPGGAGAVLKADAYGHGAARVSAVLAGAGCRNFFVAYGFEGSAVRAAVGPEAQIFVLNGPSAGHPTEWRRERLTPVLNTVDEVAAWCANSEPGPYGLHIDTGMNRLGVPAREAALAAAAARGTPPALLMSHYACADRPEAPMNRAQSEAFNAARAHFPGVPVSLANSEGHWLPEELRTGLTRPGIALFGGGTSPARSPDLKPGLTLEAPLLQVHEVRPGDTVGYGATFRAEQPALLATAALGYGDGFPRAASGSGFAYLGETRCPLIGRVSMDLVTFDVSAAAPLAKAGAWVEVLGARADLETQAAAAGTIGYELITGLGPRVERTYTS